MRGQQGYPRAMSSQQMLVQLAALGQLEQVRAVVEQEANRLKEAFLARPRNGDGGPGADALSEEEAEQIRRKYIAKELGRYEKLASRGRSSSAGEEPRTGPADRAEAENQRQRGRDEASPSSAAAEAAARQAEIDRIEARLVASLAALRKSIGAYAESHSSPPLKGAVPAIGMMQQRLSGQSRLDGTPAASASKVTERIRVTSEGVKVEATLGDEAVVGHLPWGETTHFGARRAAYVSIEAASPIPQESEESLRLELVAALRGVVGATIEPGADPAAQQRVEDWLYDADIEVLSAARFAAMETASQTLSTYRGALLALDGVEKLLAAERLALGHGGIALAQRQAGLERRKPAGTDALLKRAGEMCKGELSRFLEDAARQMEEVRVKVAEATRQGVRDHIKDFGALQVVTDKTADNAKPGRETVHVRPERVGLVCDKVKNLLLKKSNDLGQAAQLLWRGPKDKQPRDAVRPHLVEGTLRPLLSEHGLADPRVLVALEEETFFVPLADGTTTRLLEKHFDPLVEARSPALVEIEIPKMPSAKEVGYFQIISDRIRRMPNQLMAPFAGFFVLTSLLGLSGGSGRSWLKDLIGGAGAATVTLVFALILLVAVFWIASHFLLKRERRAAEAAAIERSREGVANAVLQAFDRFSGAWLGVFRPHTMSALDDVLRRASKDLDLFQNEVKARWDGESLLLHQERTAFDARVKSLEALLRGCREARATAEKDGNQLKKLLDKWEKERERSEKRGARRAAGGGE